MKRANSNSNLVESHQIKTASVPQTPNLYVALSKRAVIDRLLRLEKAVALCLEENAHLADGDNCTLIRLKEAMNK
jgi:hypothetical protein